MILGGLGRILITGEPIRGVRGDPAPFARPNGEGVALRVPMLVASAGEPIRGFVGDSEVY